VTPLLQLDSLDPAGDPATAPSERSRRQLQRELELDHHHQLQQYNELLRLEPAQKWRLDLNQDVHMDRQNRTLYLIRPPLPWPKSIRYIKSIEVCSK
jgi:hypothetical protein